MITQTQNLKWGRFSFFEECAVLSDHTVGSTQQVVLPAFSWLLAVDSVFPFFNSPAVSLSDFVSLQLCWSWFWFGLAQSSTVKALHDCGHFPTRGMPVSSVFLHTLLLFEWLSAGGAARLLRWWGNVGISSGSQAGKRSTEAHRMTHSRSEDRQTSACAYSQSLYSRRGFSLKYELSKQSLAVALRIRKNTRS